LVILLFDVPNDRIKALCGDEHGNLWIGTEKNGLLKLAKNAKTVSPFFSEGNSSSNDVRGIVLDGEKIWIATLNGVITIDSKTGNKLNHFWTFDGGLPHNNIADIFKDSKDNIWVATRSNSIINLKNDHRLTLPDMFETEFSAIAEDELGRLWAATRGRGVFLFESDTVYHFTIEDGLIADHCYAMASDGKGRIWVGHRQGLSSINVSRLTVNSFGVENSIYGDVNDLAILLNKSGELLIGMTDGVMMYDTKIEQSSEITPLLNLAQVLIKDQQHNPYLPLVLPYGKYKVQFDFVGL
jgi:ligand-binding sensor domain-containing protein